METEDGLHDWAFVDRATAENVRCLREGVPLTIDDTPLEAMIESGDPNPAPHAD